MSKGSEYQTTVDCPDCNGHHELDNCPVRNAMYEWIESGGSVDDRLDALLKDSQ